jgi:cell wall-associated NlpC family hydrolase
MRPRVWTPRTVRRRTAVFVLVAAALAALLQAPAAQAVGGGPQASPLTFGETGSGPAPGRSRLPSHATARGASTIRFSDLTSADNWAKPAIAYVAGTNDWMRDFAANPDGTYPFRPDTIETRKYLARSLVKAFAPNEAVDPSITFADLDATQMFYRYANVAVKLGWMRRGAGGTFLPDATVRMAAVHRAIVLALGMKDIAQQLDALHTSNGFTFDTPVNFGTTLLGMRLGLRYNSDDDSRDVNPRSLMPRTQVAYSLYRAKTYAVYQVGWVSDQYDGIELPALGPLRRAIVQWGIRFVGYPYVWGGEWGLANQEPSALGGQSVPGFDCSGLTWWILRATDNGYWKVAPPRPYQGWSLPERSSADMARFGTLKYGGLIPGDMMFYDGDGNGGVDHVDVYIGNGFSLDSSNSPGGVTIMPVGTGWYRDHFVHGRRIVPAPGSGSG